MLAATALALLVGGVAIAVVLKPDEPALSLARGIAVLMAIGLLGFAFLIFMAENFRERSSSLPGPSTAVGWPTPGVRPWVVLSNSGWLG
jgi:hypothetical protein